MKKGKNRFNNIAINIVDKRNLIFLFYIIAIIFSLFSMSWVKVENDIINYLDEDSRTRQGIAIMEDEFVNFGTANIMISNISLNRAEKIAEEIRGIKNITSVMFENNQDYYKNSSALFVAIFGGEDNDEITLNALKEIKEKISPFDYSISTSIGENYADQLAKDMIIIAFFAAIVIILVLLFSTKAYAEIPVFLITFGVAAILNIGTNFIYGKISFISHSVAAILQLALAIDYSIILSHRFSEEKENLEPRNAAIVAVTKAIPEISASSLTTIGGLAAMAFMRFGIGLDLSMVMMKAIFISMMTVFTLMPGLLVSFNSLIEKTKHRNFIPSVSKLGHFSIKTRFIIPPIFLVVIIGSFIFSNRLPFLFSLDEIRPFRLSESQKQKDRIINNFGRTNILALIVPSGDYASERRILDSLSEYKSVNTAIGLANTNALGDYMLTDGLTPRMFAELVDLDYEMAQILFTAYAINHEDYGKVISGISNYKVPLIDMIQFLHDEIIQGGISVDEELRKELEDNYVQLSNARLQMEGENFSRMVLNLDLPIEGEETFEFINTIYKEAEQYYNSENVFLVGESTNAYDLSLTFDKDNLIISVLSVLFVIIVLTLTFKSIVLPILLISVIQASIWINFSFPYLRGQGLYFLGFLIVSAIQMGANIDYAIVISNRYLNLKEKMEPREAIIQALNQGFTTVITSGTILAIAGFLIGFISTDGATAVLGTYIGQGTVISIILVIFVLPQLLYLGDVIIEKTSFKIKAPILLDEKEKSLQINGKLHGYVKGEINAHIKGTIIGEIKAIKEHESGLIDNNEKKEDNDNEKK